MATYFHEIWRCRYFWWSLVQLDLKARYRGSVVGLGWSLLHPLAMTAIVCMVFQGVFGMDPLEYAAYALTGLACWSYFTAVAVEACHCLFRAEAYIRQHRAPLAIYPLRSALGSLAHLLVALVLVLVVAGLVHGFDRPAALACLVPGVLLLFVFGWSVAAIVGLTNVYFRDTQHLADVGFKFLFYATPVLYPAELLQERRLGWLVTYNPLASLLDLIRIPVLEGRIPSALTYGIALLAVGVATVIAGLLFSRLQRKVVLRF